MRPDQECQHKAGFTFVCQDATKLEKYVLSYYKCSCNCGYTLNFNPENFVNGIAFSIRQERKTITLVSSKRG